MPKGSTGPGAVLPPGPPGTGVGELLSSLPMNGLTYWVSGSTTACAGAGHATAAPVAMSTLAPTVDSRLTQPRRPVAGEELRDMTFSLSDDPVCRVGRQRFPPSL